MLKRAEFLPLVILHLGIILDSAVPLIPSALCFTHVVQGSFLSKDTSCDQQFCRVVNNGRNT